MISVSIKCLAQGHNTVPDWRGLNQVEQSITELKVNEPRHVISMACGILTSVDSDEPVQTPLKFRNFK